MGLRAWDEWFVNCHVMKKNDMQMHIHHRWWSKKVSYIYVGQDREDGGASVMHRIEFARLDGFDDLLDMLSSTWSESASRVRRVCSCCG